MFSFWPLHPYVTRFLPTNIYSSHFLLLYTFFQSFFLLSLSISLFSLSLEFPAARAPTAKLFQLAPSPQDGLSSHGRCARFLAAVAGEKDSESQLVHAEHPAGGAVGHSSQETRQDHHWGLVQRATQMLEL